MGEVTNEFYRFVLHGLFHSFSFLADDLLHTKTKENIKECLNVGTEQKERHSNYFLGEDELIMDMFFETMEEARKTNKLYEKYWRYMGTAKHEKGYVAWRTNSKKDLEKLLKHEDYSDISIDKPIGITRVLKRASTKAEIMLKDDA